MSPSLKISVFVGLLALSGWVGAYVSKFVRDGTVPAIASLLAGQVALVTWALMAKDKSMELVAAAVVFDAVYSLAWFATYYFMGVPYSATQVAGCCFLLLGMVLVNL